MNMTKAPDHPDGMPPMFNQTYWKTLGPGVTKVILLALNTSMFPSDLNHTFIALILKKKSPESVADFRPISLCNVIYKILSKVLTNRPKVILPHIISKTQSTFVTRKAHFY